MKAAKNNVKWLEKAKGEPYRLWSCDLLSCVKCGNQTLTTAQSPYAEHFEPDFQERLTEARAEKFFYEE